MLTKNHIIYQFNNDLELAQYLPDQVSPSSITRSFLLALLYNVKREKYKLLYNIYKEHKKQSSTSNGKIFQIIVGNEFATSLSDYTSTTK